jgi:hypothetical protein
MHDNLFIYLIYANAVVLIVCIVWFIYRGGD